jgi:esterase/lipase superfamily enzyme
VHLIAHSMGSRAMTEALTRVIGRPAAAGHARFRQVVLAAPDIDADVFRELVEKFRGGAERVTLYASSKDEALAASRKLHGGYTRAGETEPDVLVVPGIDTIDASAVATGLGHSYYGDDPTIVSDLFYYLLRTGAPPGERHRLVERTQGELTYWELRP